MVRERSVSGSRNEYILANPILDTCEKEDQNKGGQSNDLKIEQSNGHTNEHTNGQINGVTNEHSKVDVSAAAHSQSMEEPPSYEESVQEDWNSNLTWPNTLANRDELAQLFRINNYDYCTRGRAFTVAGPSEGAAPRYRNIINYFENSLDDISSVEWSNGSSDALHRSLLQLQESREASTDAITTVTRTMSVPTSILQSTSLSPHPNVDAQLSAADPTLPLLPPLPPLAPTPSAARVSSREVVHWQCINDDRATNKRTRFTVRLVQTTDELPPNYTITGPHLLHSTPGSPDRPLTTSGTCSIPNSENFREHAQNFLDQTQPPEITGTKKYQLADKSFKGNEFGTALSKQPSAPSLDQLDSISVQAEEAGEEKAMFGDEAFYSGNFGRVTTAPARLDQEECDPVMVQLPSTDLDTKQRVSFYMGEPGEPTENSIVEMPDSAAVQLSNPPPKGSAARVYTPSNGNYQDIDKKDSRASETGDSGYGDEASYFISEATPLKISDIVSGSSGNPRQNAFEHVITLDGDSGKGKSQLLTADRTGSTSPSQWENHRLFRIDERKKKKTWRFYGAVLFFLVDVVMIITGALLLVMDYQRSAITGFVLLGLGVGMCIPALNYSGGLTTVMSGVGT